MFRWFATCGATPQVDGEGGCFFTEDQGTTWRRIFDGGPGQQQAKGFAEGHGYAIGLALNPFRQGELFVTAGDRPPGQLAADLEHCWSLHGVWCLYDSRFCVCGDVFVELSMQLHCTLCRIVSRRCCAALHAAAAYWQTKPDGVLPIFSHLKISCNKVYNTER